MSDNSAQTSKQAVALKYNKSNGDQKAAPTVVAKGYGDIAQEIVAIANQHGLLVHEDKELSDILTQLDLGQEIPESLYHVIAELIAFAYVLQGKFPDNWQNTHQHIDFTE